MRQYRISKASAIIVAALTALPLAATAQTDKPWEDIIASMEGAEFLVCPDARYFRVVPIRRDDKGKIAWDERYKFGQVTSELGVITVVTGPSTFVLMEDRFVMIDFGEVIQGACFNATDDIAFALSIVSR